MRPLIVTEKVGMGEDIFGYLHGHLLDAAKDYKKSHVICLEKGEHKLPENVAVYSLGKESGAKGKFGYLIALWKIFWKLRSEYDVVIVYLTPLYVRAAAPLLKILGKKIVLWYNHPQMDDHLPSAEKFVTVLATPASNRCRSGVINVSLCPKAST